MSKYTGSQRRAIRQTLTRKDPHGPSLCVPVLPGGAEAALPRETVEYLQRVEVRETSLVWRDDVDLMALRHAGNLTLTLLRDDALNSSECSALASSVVRTVHRRGQRDAGLEEEEASSAATTVAREILQEAAAHVRGALGEALGEALRLQKERLWVQNGRRSAQLEEMLRALQKWCAVPKLHDKDIEQQLTQMLNEFTDGEFTLALTSMTSESQRSMILIPYGDGRRMRLLQICRIADRSISGFWHSGFHT
ncbi:unnamed protein product [Merluccius merluccius]